jgi:hypothetical protein
MTVGHLSDARVTDLMGPGALNPWSTPRTTSRLGVAVRCDGCGVAVHKANLTKFHDQRYYPSCLYDRA